MILPRSRRKLPIKISFNILESAYEPASRAGFFV
jgi:hypothetical protein